MAFCPDVFRLGLRISNQQFDLPPLDTTTGIDFVNSHLRATQLIQPLLHKGLFAGN